MTIFALRCISLSLPGNRYLDYKLPNVYEYCNFQYLEVYNVDLDTCSRVDLCNLPFRENDTIIAYDAYSHFVLLQYELYRLGVELDTENFYTYCVKDLANILNVNTDSVTNLRDVANIFIKLCYIPTNNFIQEHKKCWIEYGIRPEITKTSGKWMMHVKKCHLHIIWDILMKNKRFLNLTYVKSSTGAINIWGGKPTYGVIMVYYDNINIEEFGLRLKNKLKSCKFLNKIVSKSDMQSIAGSRIQGLSKNMLREIVIR